MDMNDGFCYHIGSVGGAAGRPRPYGVPAYERRDAYLPPSSAMWSLETLLRILVEPAGFFRDRRDDCAFSQVASFCIIHAVVMTVVGLAAGFIGAAAVGQAPDTLADSIRTVSALAIYAAVAALASFALSVAIAALLHPLVWLLRGTGGFRATYASVVYAAAPAGLLFVLGVYVAELMPEESGASIAVWLNLAGALWAVALFGMGVTEMNGMNALSGSLVTIAPLAALAAVAVWLAGPDAGRRGLQVPTFTISGITVRNPVRSLLPTLSLNSEGAAQRAATAGTRKRDGKSSVRNGRSGISAPNRRAKASQRRAGSGPANR